ncbi:MAG TPA: peptidase S41, partial [Rhodanobacteraceae bacterium]
MPLPRLMPALLLLCSGLALAAPPSEAPRAATPAAQQKAQPQESPADVTPENAPASASSIPAPDSDVPDLADIRAFTRVYSMVKQ